MNLQENIRRILREDIDIKHMTSLLRRHEYVLNLIMKRCSIFQMTYDICEESSEDFVDVIITDTLLTIKGKVFIGMEKNQSELSFGLMKEFLTKKYGELIIEYYNRYCNYQELDEYARTLKNARQQGVGLRFPKSAIKSNPSRFRPYNRKGVNESDLETNQNDKRIVCEKCGWSWDLSDGGDDPYTCHKCGNENHKEMNLQESIRRILREETKLIPMIRRRVPHDDLEREFEESLDATSNNLFNLIKNGGGVIPLGRFIHITVSRLIDRIHYEIYSTTPEDSVWYADVANSLIDYYKDRIEVRYKKLMSEI